MSYRPDSAKKVRKKQLVRFGPRYHKELFPFTRAQSHRHIGITYGFTRLLWTAVPPPVIPSAGGLQTLNRRTFFVAQEFLEDQRKGPPLPPRGEVERIRYTRDTLYEKECRPSNFCSVIVSMGNTQ